LALEILSSVDQYAVLTKNCSGNWTENEIREIRTYYFAMLAEVDNMLGELFRVVPKDTVIFFTSDHGDLAMEHQQYYKMSFYEGSSRCEISSEWINRLRVPLIASGPVFKSNQKDASIRSLLDIYPTLLSLANTTTDHELDGLSLIEKADNLKNRAVLAQYHAEHMNASGYMIVQRDFKFIYYRTRFRNYFSYEKTHFLRRDKQSKIPAF
jgi:arylsulfatase K